MPSLPTIVTTKLNRFYDNRIAVSAFCLICLVVILWEVSRFEGFQPIFRCADTKDVDRVLLSEGMTACMGHARSQPDQAQCLRTVHILACTKEIWR